MIIPKIALLFVQIAVANYQKAVLDIAENGTIL